jgi:hypothetical protein
MILFALLTLATLPHDGTLNERFDCMDLNHVYSYDEENDTNCYTFTQLLFYKFDDQQGTHVIEAWKMQRSQSSGNKQFADPCYNWDKGVWEVRIENRVIEATAFRETSADFDIEVRERDFFPVWYRRDLRTLKPK